MRDIDYPIQMSLGAEFRSRPLRARIRDTLLFLWVAFWLTVGIVLTFAIGSVS